MTNQDTTYQQQQPPQQEGVADTGSGFLTGVEPAQARRAVDWSGQSGNQALVQPQPQTQQPVTLPPEFVAAARQQEEQLQMVTAQLQELREAREAELAEKQRLADEADAARREKEEAEMDLRALMEKRDAEFQAQLEERDRRYEADRAVFEQERRLNEVNEYRRQRIEQEAEYIDPNLRDMVGGSTIEEIDQSIEFIKERSAAIAANYAAAAQQQQPFRGGTAMPSVPPVGPMEQLPSYEQLRPEDIAGMDMDTYKRYRTQLLQATNPNRRRGQ
jgi:hypothetical protein